MKKYKVEGRFYVLLSSASKFAFFANGGKEGNPTSIFIMEKLNVLRMLDECKELFKRNSENVVCWKGIKHVEIERALNKDIEHRDERIPFARIDCPIRKDSMQKDAHGTRATVQELIIRDFFGGRHIGGLHNSGGISAGDSGKLGDVLLLNGEQVEVKGWSGRLAGLVSEEALKKAVKDGLLTAEEYAEITRE